MTELPIILASESPRRKQLLDQINLTCTVIPSGLLEDKHDGQAPEEYAAELAAAKAAAVAEKHPDALVIGADTIVILENEILGKPTDRDDAFLILSKLSGRTHTVITGVSIQSKKHSISDNLFEETQVSFKKISDFDIYTYIDTYQPFDKAGSYGIQDYSSIFVEKINGSYDNVVGFPLSKFNNELKKLNINL